MTEEDKGQDPNKENDPPKDNKNAMKAFYRAMYAGADPDPDDYGIKVEKEEGSGRDSVSSAELARMQQELDEMEKRCQEAENLYKRMAADFENYRKRMAKEKEEFAAVGIQKAIEAMLPALDDMDLAVNKLNAEMETKSILESLEMVYKRFARCLEQIGIKQLDAIGEQFDPRLHEPMQQVVDNSVPEGSVVFQLRPGYQFNDKILRPSLVNVATGGSEPEPAAPAEEEEEEIVEEIIIEEEIVEEEVPEEEAEQSQETSVEERVEEQANQANINESDDSANNQDLASTQDIPNLEIQEKLKEAQKEESESQK